jgi:hypothetical protein
MSDFAALFPRRSEAGRECETPPVVGWFTARAGSDDASRVGALCCRARSVAGEFGRASARARSRVVGEVVMFLPNHAVEATAPRRFSFDGFWFHNTIVPGEAALPGAVPHLGRSTAMHGV